MHRPVLFNEAVSALNVRPDGIYVDATFGRGGHAGAILAQLGADGRLLAIDKDPEAVAVAREKFGEDARFAIERGSFVSLETLIQQRDWMGKVDGILLDLGVSSPQLDKAERGFSFLKDGPLDMRMDPDQGESAAAWLARATDREIADVLKRFGEERYAKRIARAIVAARTEAPIINTARLAKVVAEANPSWEKGKHPATRSFQAIRIYINRELEDLESVLDQSLRVLAPGGRLAVISFHSLEDRLVKRFMRDQARGDEIPHGLPVREDQIGRRMRLIGKAQRAGEQELDENPRARSAVLRVAERLA